MSEHRQALRMRRLKDARMVFNDRKSVMNCTVRNASALGAKLLMAEPHMVPPEFELTISGSDPRPARKIWFKDGEMGVKFL
ncbi:MAG: PilZ domain-containing protein [Aestuariivirga sp.]